MRLTFTEQEIQQELNKIYLEEDDLLMEGEWLEGEGRHYIISGVATIEGERYHEFEIEFELLEDPQEQTAVGILSVDWDWYDFYAKKEEWKHEHISLFYARRYILWTGLYCRT